MINKSLKKLLNKKKVDSLSSLSGNLRPENVSSEMYYKITNLVEN